METTANKTQEPESKSKHSQGSKPSLTRYSQVSTFTRYNLDENLSDIAIFVNEFRDRCLLQLNNDMEKTYSPFISFDEYSVPLMRDTWVKENFDKFLKNTPNEFLSSESFLSEAGYMTAAVFDPTGEFIIVGHSTGLIQMRHGHTGTMLATLRNIQFPPKPVYSLEYSRSEEKVCYAVCTDGVVYRIEIPTIDTGDSESVKQCIQADPNLEWLNTQFYGSPGLSQAATPFILGQRTPALSLGMTTDSSKMVVGYGDTSVKVFDMNTQETETTYKVHKLRLAFIPKTLQRIHCGQVCAVSCHNERPHVFASGGWDNTLRIWDIRCKVGCMMTFEGVNICHDSIDLNRDCCVVGSWSPTEAVTTWDLAARKRLNVIRVQNRRPDIDGEYIYACKYWRSAQYNRKGKYAIIGGSGTGAVEVINLHNRYITCSYPAPGTILAVASHGDRIAFGGTAQVFSIVRFHDPKHEKYSAAIEQEYDYTKHDCTLVEYVPVPDPESPSEVIRKAVMTDISRYPKGMEKKRKKSSSEATTEPRKSAA